MGANSKIEWTDHTFNPWIGCSKVSAGCAHCYAEDMMDHRYKTVQWGPVGTRICTSPANWKKPLQWNKAAQDSPTRPRVFCASLADIFEDRPELTPWRMQLWELILQTPNLDWLLLTKRPENICNMLPFHNCELPLPNVWIGTSVENQEQADIRIPHLLKVPAIVRFLSMEPLLGPVYFDSEPDLPFDEKTGEFIGWTPYDPAKPTRKPTSWEVFSHSFHDETGTHSFHGIDWIIIGGESGPKARPMNPLWAQDLILNIKWMGEAARVAILFKQWGEWFPREQWEGNPHLVLPDDDIAFNTNGPNLIIQKDEIDNTHVFHKLGKHAAGRTIDGRTWDEYPEVHLAQT